MIDPAVKAAHAREAQAAIRVNDAANALRAATKAMTEANLAYHEACAATIQAIAKVKARLVDGA